MAKSYLSASDYKGHKANIELLNSGSMELGAVQYANPDKPIYKDAVTGKYTSDPTPNYPNDIKTWYKTNTANDAMAKKNVSEWPYNSSGTLSKEGFKKFKAEVKFNKPVAVDRTLYKTEARESASANVVHDIAQLDSDIRDSRIKASMLIQHREMMKTKFTQTSSDGGIQFKPNTKFHEKVYFNELLTVIKLTATLTTVGGTEREERQKDPNNEIFSSYHKVVPMEKENGQYIDPRDLSTNELDSSVPQRGEDFDHATSVDEDGANTGETEETLKKKLEVAKSLIQDKSQMNLKNLLSDSATVDTSETNIDSEDTLDNNTEKVGTDSKENSGTSVSQTGSSTSIVQTKSGDEEPPATGDKKFDEWRQHPGGIPRPNMLHYFSSFNTQFELYLMNPNDYNHINNKITMDKWSEQYFFDFTNLEERLIINSAGVRTSDKYLKTGSSQNRFFADRDYFIDNVELLSFVAPSKKSAGAKFTNLQLEIFEPYGSTLLENLIRATASKPIEGETYLDMPYLLKIKFNGFDELGEKLNTRIPMPADPIHNFGETQYSQNDFGTKYLMLKISNMNFKITAEGTVYSLEMINYNSFAIEDYGGTLEANIQVNSTSLGSFFGLTDGASDDIAEFHVDSVARDDTNVKVIKRDQDGKPMYKQDFRIRPGDPSQFDPIYDDGTGYYYGEGPQNRYRKPKLFVRKGSTHRSFPAILNSIQKAKTETDNNGNIAQNYADTYEFKFKKGQFDDSFLDKKIVKPDSIDVNHVPVFNDKIKAVYPEISQWQFGTQEGFETAFQIQAGKSILDVIHGVISTSTFMTDQVESSTKLRSPPGYTSGLQEFETTYFFTPNKPILLYKITPLVNIGKWDAKRKTYQKHFKYVIELYDAQGEAETDMGKYAVTDVCKQYDYLYTGTNKDVLEFDLDFQAGAFETNIIGGFTKSLASKTSAEVTKRASDKMNAAAFASAFISATKNVRQNQARWLPSHGGHDFQIVKASNLMTRIYNGGADRLAGTLQIMGDPDFIVQDEGFDLDSYVSFSPNGSIATKKQPIILLNFLTPVDINSSTGTIHNANDDHSPGYAEEAYGVKGYGGNSTSVFSGYYKIMTISSSFSGNMFTQELNLVRVGNQEYDYPDDQKPKSKEVTRVLGKVTKQKIIWDENEREKLKENYEKQKAEASAKKSKGTWRSTSGTGGYWTPGGTYYPPKKYDSAVGTTAPGEASDPYWKKAGKGNVE